MKIAGWDQEAEEVKAWENLKARFRESCTNQADWLIDEERRMLYNMVSPSHMAVQSCVYPFWANIREAKESNGKG